ncbi:MAG: trypsin-like peptidase domain-containing protein [Moorea sp. SIO2I5]|nr:trypsin-like peptidase domain-containing protein [Moorena sp. SIO2I5]
MLGLPGDFHKRLLEILLTIPQFNERENRNLLFEDLPPQPVANINRSNTTRTDLHNLITSAKTWGQLSSGEWALVVIAKNAIPFVKGTEPGRSLENLLAELETSNNVIPLSPKVVNEALLWNQDERLPVDFLIKGFTAAKSVARVQVPRIINGILHRGYGTGTGWLIAPNLLLTNHHVIEVRDRREAPATESDLEQQALRTIAWFGYVDRSEKYEEYSCTELVHFDSELDYALLRLSSDALSGQALENWGYLSISSLNTEIAQGSRLNIIQHPQGGPQRVAIRNNFYVDTVSQNTSLNRISYLTDTEPGSSGSPVFNDNWEVVALHHASVKIQPNQYRGEVIKYNNQGILIHTILDNLPVSVKQELHTSS